MAKTSNEDWTREEVEAVVADYRHMLMQELAGQTYNKTAHRQALKSKLRGRTDGSIERKHQNISAVLIELRCPYIPGYKPLSNYQALLFDVVAEQLGGDPLFDRLALIAAEQPAVAPLDSNFVSILEDPPKCRQRSEAEEAIYLPKSIGVRRDYLDREARNHSLGKAGEVFVVAFERFRLYSAGQSRLSDLVQHVSVTKGDGLGYDVLSFETDGRERFIEVKTTGFGKDTPFFMSRTEVAFSEVCAEQFHLYRLFEFRRRPRMFELCGKVQDNVRLDPVSYLARFV